MEGERVMDEVKFTAVLSRTSAVTIGGEDGDSKIRLEAPASELAEIVKLAAYGRNIALEVRVRPAQPTLTQIQGHNEA